MMYIEIRIETVSRLRSIVMSWILPRVVRLTDECQIVSMQRINQCSFSGHERFISSVSWPLGAIMCYPIYVCR
jgi:hypothetical protein